MLPVFYNLYISSLCVRIFLVKKLVISDNTIIAKFYMQVHSFYYLIEKVVKLLLTHDYVLQNNSIRLILIYILPNYGIIWRIQSEYNMSPDNALIEQNIFSLYLLCFSVKVAKCGEL
jgi:hypothetical protein